MENVETRLGPPPLGGGKPTLVSFGIVVLAGDDTLTGMATIGGGMMVIGIGASLLPRESAIRRVRAWWDTITADPAELPSAETTSGRPGSDDKCP